MDADKMATDTIGRENGSPCVEPSSLCPGQFPLSHFNYDLFPVMNLHSGLKIENWPSAAHPTPVSSLHNPTSDLGPKLAFLPEASPKYLQFKKHAFLQIQN